MGESSTSSSNGEPLARDLKIRHHDGFRFFVQSESDPDDEWLVDLEELNGHGECQCPNFQMKLLPLFRKGHRGPKVTCKHLAAVHRGFSRWSVIQVVRGRPVR